MPHRIIFFGSGDFSIPSLQMLLDDSRFDVVAVVTNPDRPVGRHQTIQPPLVKALAEKRKITVFQFENIKTDEAFKSLSTRPVDAYVVVSYGQIIPQRILDLPKMGVINLHGSLLPRWRGASCVQAAIAAGDSESGISIMKIDAQMDHGPILHQESEPIKPNDTGALLFRRLAHAGAEALPESLHEYLHGNLAPVAQDETKATICKILSRENGKIDWNKSAEEIERLIRAYDPWPGTWTEWQGKRVKILTSHLAVDDINSALGEPLIKDDRLLVRCGDGRALEITKLQPEGAKAMDASDYARGHK